MSMTAGQFLALLQPGLDRVRSHEDANRPLQYTQAFNDFPLARLDYDEAKMAAFGLLQQLGEGQEVVYDQAIPPVTKTWTYDEYGLGYRITEKLRREEQYGQINKLEGLLDRSVDATIETYFFAVLNNPTSTTALGSNSVGFDGLALASTAHTRLDGGATQANRPSSLANLSLTGIQDWIIATRKLKDDRGRPVLYTPKTLGITADDIMVAEELLGSELKPDTANNTTNAIRRFGLNYTVFDYLTGTRPWFGLCTEHDLRAGFRYRPTKTMVVDFDTDDIKRKVKVGVVRGFGEWYGYWLGQT